MRTPTSPRRDASTRRRQPRRLAGAVAVGAVAAGALGSRPRPVAPLTWRRPSPKGWQLPQKTPASAYNCDHQKLWVRRAKSGEGRRPQERHFKGVTQGPGNKWRAQVYMKGKVCPRNGCLPVPFSHHIVFLRQIIISRTFVFDKLRVPMLEFRIQKQRRCNSPGMQINLLFMEVLPVFLVAV